MKAFWRKQPVRTYSDGPDWNSRVFRDFFREVIVYRLHDCDFSGSCPMFHATVGGRELAVASALGKVIVVSPDAALLESLADRLWSQNYLYDLTYTPPGTRGGTGMLLCASRLYDIPPGADETWAQRVHQTLGDKIALGQPANRMIY